jgi:branched-chain amino acid transport system ATP-binding protein
MLRLNNICAGYGDLKVLFDVSISLEEGETVALVGSNGAGKTTVLRTISGLTPTTSGSIMWFNKDVTHMPAFLRPSALGIAHIPQGRGILSTITVNDNLLLGGVNLKDKHKRQKNIDKAYDLYPMLKERKNHLAGTLSGGQQQMLAIARAIISEPKLLILDEPSLGLAPVVIENVFDMLKVLKAHKTSMLIIEQNLVRTLNVADRGYVMETGRITIEGSSKELMENPKVQKAYLGI